MLYTTLLTTCKYWQLYTSPITLNTEGDTFNAITMRYKQWLVIVIFSSIVVTCNSWFSFYLEFN